MALLNLGDDPWLLEYDSCNNLNREIMEHLSERQKLSRKADKNSQLSANIRLKLKQFNNEVLQLKQKLDTITLADLITLAESERRTRQIEVLHSKAIQMQKAYEEQISSKVLEERNQLLGDNSSGWNNEDTIQTVDQLKAQQRRLIGEQDQGLESLSQIIARQKNIAHTITNEVDLHNEILDDLGMNIDHTNSRVRNETQHVTIVDRKDKTCGYWVVIILLLISIIIVAAL